MPADQARGAVRRIVPILLVALATLIAFAAISEGAARLLLTQSSTTTVQCLIVNDPATGVRGIPGSTCHQKAYESPLITYHFNACGFRTPQSCGPAPAGTYRIVLLGSSVALGMNVEQPQSFAGVLGPMLSSRLDQRIDVFNEAMQWGLPAGIARRGDRLTMPHPDMILWPLTPFDITNAGLVLPYIGGVQEGVSVSDPATPPATSTTPPAKGWATLPGRIWKRLIGPVSDSRTVLLLQNLLFRSDSQYLSHIQAQGEDADYLRTPPPPALKSHLATFAEALGQVARQAQAARVPLVVTLLPSRAQAVMIADRKRDAGYDAQQLGHLLRPIVEQAGGQYLDMTPGLDRYPGASQRYFRVDEHLPPDGNVMLARLLTDALAKSRVIPAGSARR